MYSQYIGTYIRFNGHLHSAVGIDARVVAPFHRPNFNFDFVSKGVQ